MLHIVVNLSFIELENIVRKLTANESDDILSFFHFQLKFMKRLFSSDFVDNVRRETGDEH